MPFGPYRGWSKVITGGQARELIAADRFAGEIACPLLYRIHVNWGRTVLGDDVDGWALAAYRARIARWLRHPDQGRHAFHAIYVRERPSGVSAKPNDHIHLHVPPDLVGRFLTVASSLLPRQAFPIDRRAVVVDPIGWTTPARQGALAYLLKGTAPRAAQLIRKDRLLAINPKPQGGIQGKRCGVTQTLNRAARQRHCSKLTDRGAAQALIA